MFEGLGSKLNSLGKDISLPSSHETQDSQQAVSFSDPRYSIIPARVPPSRFPSPGTHLILGLWKGVEAQRSETRATDSLFVAHRQLRWLPIALLRPSLRSCVERPQLAGSKSGRTKPTDQKVWTGPPTPLISNGEFKENVH
jgi:hypothetical protein